MTKLNLTLLNLGIVGGALAVACSADSPNTTAQPATPGATAPMQPSTLATNPVTPGIVMVTPSTQPIATTPQPVATSPGVQPTVAPGATVGAPPGTQQGPGLPMPPVGGTPTAQGTAPAQVDPGPAQSPQPAAPEPEPDPTPAGGEGNMIIPNDKGWVAVSTNGVGVQGSWYDYQDDVTEDFERTVESGTVCMTGTTAEAEEDNYDIYGAAIGFNFNDEDPWDGSAYSGISFTATVDSDADVLVKLTMAKTKVVDGGEHFTTLRSGKNSIDWSDFEQPSWVADNGDDEDLDPSDIAAIQFLVQPGPTGPNPFSVCISDMAIED